MTTPEEEASAAVFRAELAQLRDHLGPGPRPGIDQAVSSSRRPTWALNDPLKQFFSHRDRLLSEGFVVWGHVVQANEKMFEQSGGLFGSKGHPGEIVYCPDPTVDISPVHLMQTAHALFELKGTAQEDAHLGYFSHYLADELTRVFELPVPPELTGGAPLVVTSVFFDRQHLPDGVLGAGLLPVLALREPDPVVMAVPAQLWPPSFRAWWQSTAQTE